jgi:hypothetical protein
MAFYGGLKSGLRSGLKTFSRKKVDNNFEIREKGYIFAQNV